MPPDLERRTVRHAFCSEQYAPSASVVFACAAQHDGCVQAAARGEVVTP
jgi:hypothetical protein